MKFKIFIVLFLILVIEFVLFNFYDQKIKPIIILRNCFSGSKECSQPSNGGTLTAEDMVSTWILQLCETDNDCVRVECNIVINKNYEFLWYLINGNDLILNNSYCNNYLEVKCGGEETYPNVCKVA